MTRSALMILLLLMSAVATSCGRGTDRDAAPRVRIAAAASLGGVLGQLQPTCLERLGVEIELDLGSSGTLAQQVIAGAPTDAFISANEKWMRELERRGLLAGDAPITLVRNRLVLIVSEGTPPPTSLHDVVAGTGRVAIGEPKSVPAGQYAEEALRAAGVWDSLQPRLLTAVDARAALAYVERGEADYGIVYHTDALSSRDVRISFTIDELLHQPIEYHAAVLRDARDPVAARRVLAWLTRSTAADAFAAAGFVVPSRGAAGGGGG